MDVYVALEKKRKMDPKVWGPHAWTFLHLSALHADRSQGRSEWKDLMSAFVANLPCEECKKHAKAYWASYEYTDTTSAFEWTVIFHNRVNERLGKPTVELSKALKQWDHEHCTLQCVEPEMPSKEALKKPPNVLDKPVSTILVCTFLIVICLIFLWYGYIFNQRPLHSK